jgi:hypothetical protein
LIKKGLLWFMTFILNRPLSSDILDKWHSPAGIKVASAIVVPFLLSVLPLWHAALSLLEQINISCPEL